MTIICIDGINKKVYTDSLATVYKFRWNAERPFYSFYLKFKSIYFEGGLNCVPNEYTKIDLQYLNTNKIFYAEPGRIITGCGNLQELKLNAKRLLGGKTPKLKYGTLLVVTDHPEGLFVEAYTNKKTGQIVSRYQCWGSGRQMTKIAYDITRDIKKALDYTCENHDTCGGEIIEKSVLLPDDIQ